MITCILVDDEQKALKILESKLKRNFPEIEIIEMYRKPQEALEVLQNNQPDLLFLDIAMPKISGFDLLAAVENPEFEIIFVTAYDNYAIEAIKHTAIGYIVKPIANDELKIAIENAKKNIKKKLTLSNNKALIGLLSEKSNTISVPTQNGYRFIKIEDIIRLEGVDGYTKIVCAGSEYLSSYSLGRFMEQIKENQFIKVHRSHVINIRFVEEYLKEGSILLKNNESVPLSRNNKKAFFSTMRQI